MKVKYASSNFNIFQNTISSHSSFIIYSSPKIKKSRNPQKKSEEIPQKSIRICTVQLKVKCANSNFNIFKTLSALLHCLSLDFNRSENKSKNWKSKRKSRRSPKRWNKICTVQLKVKCATINFNSFQNTINSLSSPASSVHHNFNRKIHKTTLISSAYYEIVLLNCLTFTFIFLIFFAFHFHFLCFSLSPLFNFTFFMGFQNTFSCHPPAKLGGEKKLMNAPLMLFTFTFHRLMRYFELLSISQRSVSWWSFVYVLFMFTFVAFHFHFSKYDEMPPIIRNWC